MGIPRTTNSLRTAKISHSLAFQDRFRFVQKTNVVRIFQFDCLHNFMTTKCQMVPVKIAPLFVPCAMCHIAKHQLSVGDIVYSAIMSADIKASIANNSKTLIGLEYIAVLIDPTDSHFSRFRCLLCRVNEKAVLAQVIMNHIESDTHQLHYLVSRTSCVTIVRSNCI